MIDLLIAVALIGAATASISRLVSAERGPYAVLARLRSKLPPVDDGTLKGEIGQLINCPICLGVWVATVLSVLYALATLFAPALNALLVIPAAIGVSYALVGLGNLWSGGEQ